MRHGLMYLLLQGVQLVAGVVLALLLSLGVGVTGLKAAGGQQWVLVRRGRRDGISTTPQILASGKIATGKSLAFRPLGAPNGPQDGRKTARDEKLVAGKASRHLGADVANRKHDV